MGQRFSSSPSSGERLPRMSILDKAFNFGLRLYLPSPPIGHEGSTDAENLARLGPLREKILATTGAQYKKTVKGKWTVGEERLPRPDNLSKVDGPVRVLVHAPISKHADLPLVVYAHGGGLTTADCQDAIAANLFNQIASRLSRDHQQQFCWVSVDYRLAPEAKFPKAVDDFEHAFVALQDPALAEKYGYDPKKIGVAGLSAGGFLAGHAAHRLATAAQAGQGLAPAFVATLCAMVDPSMRWETHTTWSHVPLCYGAFVRFCWRALLADGEDEEPSETRQREASLLQLDWSPCQGLRMMNAVTLCDVLADEDLALTKVMVAGGATVEEIVTEGSHSLGLVLHADAKEKLISWWCRTLSEL